MEKIASDFKDKGVVFYTLYTREPHPGQQFQGMDFSKKTLTRTREERVDNALEMIRKHALKRGVLIDTFGPDCLQERIGGGGPNSLIVVDRAGKAALWQKWSDPVELRATLEQMTAARPSSSPAKSQGRARVSVR